LLTVVGLLTLGIGFGIVSKLILSSCGNDVWSEEKSPDGKWKAVIFIVDCGATTTDKEAAPQVSVLPATDRLSKLETGNVFGISPVAGITHPQVNVSWSGSNNLTIRYRSGAHVFQQKLKYQDVTISYVGEP
jgi:hypothetical protein